MCCNSQFQFLYNWVARTFRLTSNVFQYSSTDISLLHHNFHSVMFSPTLSASSRKNWLTVLEKKNALKKNRSLQVKKKKKILFLKRIQNPNVHMSKGQTAVLNSKTVEREKRCTIKLYSKWQPLREIVNTILCNGHHRCTAHKSKQ